ncbi:MAG: hypothetical protein QGG12_01185 [Prochlorococcaceae cyanobacterium ETNP18_MAG_14]|nr:hypothetical protein [Prochlorococcaceae cyanobacterium ETNP18_MAG_14]
MVANLAAAEAAISRGDYGQSLALLEPLAKSHPLPQAEGARIRMLMVTAWMGQGNEQKALATCRILTRCKDPELRQNAKQLLIVLEAPSLQRPANWSIRLPNLAMSATTTAARPSSARKRSLGPPPPTGLTRAPQLGFSVLVFVVLIWLTILLSGAAYVSPPQ